MSPRASVNEESGWPQGIGFQFSPSDDVQAWLWLLDEDEPLTARNIDPFDSMVPLDPLQ